MASLPTAHAVGFNSFTPLRGFDRLGQLEWSRFEWPKSEAEKQVLRPLSPRELGSRIPQNDNLSFSSTFTFLLQELSFRAQRGICSYGTAGKQQIPHRLKPVRNDKLKVSQSGPNDKWNEADSE